MENCIEQLSKDWALKKSNDDKFEAIIQLLRTILLEELISCSQTYYKSHEKMNYKAFSNAWLNDLVKNKRYLSVLYHYFLRKIPLIGEYLAERSKGIKVPKEYFVGPPFFYHFQLFSKVKSMDEENSGEYHQALSDLYYNMGEYEWIYDNLSDEESKFVFVELMLARLLQDPMIYFTLNNCSGVQYFEKSLINISDNKTEVFVDVGGYTGDTSLTFAQLYSDYKKIYLYEPSLRNYRKATRGLEGYNNIVFSNKGVSNSSGYIRFCENRSASCIDRTSKEVIETITLDEDIAEDITFIKIDTEGHEMNVLEGAKNHLIRNKPKIAVSAYHQYNDIWKIPRYINSVNTKYKFYLRHYSNNYSETVLYAL